jgi:DNA repair and recombination protein RAD52
MTFTDGMKGELAKPLNPRHVKPPAPGKYGEYIEGWRVIDEANRIFGFDGWTRETVEMEEVCRAETKIGRNNDPGWMVGYRAKVRVIAQGVVREGSAVGNGEARKLYDAVESAVKEAETDAMKRALMTFGNPFGLALYDKSKANVGSDGVVVSEPAVITDDQRDIIATTASAAGVSLQTICKTYKVDALPQLPVELFDVVMESLRLTIAKKKEKVTA